MSKTYGFRITGRIHSVDIDEFVLDEYDVDRVHVAQPIDRFTLASAIVACAHNGASLTINDEQLSVELIHHDIDAPRYVMLRGVKGGNRFYSRYEAEQRYKVRELHTGEVAYEIIGFADSVAEVQRKLYRSKVPAFPSSHTLGILSTHGVHESHCCVKHGCKYGDVHCPVAYQYLPQKYPCESCADDERAQKGEEA